MSTVERPDPGDPPSWVVEWARRYLPDGLPESVIRTWVPVVVGAALTYAASRLDLAIPDGAATGVIIATTALITGGYYAVCRLIERRWPRVGRWLLAFGLVKTKPAYLVKGEVVASTVIGTTRKIE